MESRADMTENIDEKPRLTLLTAIASAITAWVASAVILASIGYGTTGALTIAPIIAAAVFGAFLVKIYAMKKKAPRPVAIPADQLPVAVPTELPVAVPTELPVATTPADQLPVVVPTDQFPVVRPAEQRCLILAAPTHGVLQDRMNYWLKGGYGKVTSSSMAVTEKGFYMTIFYYDIDEIAEVIKELPKSETKRLADMNVKKELPGNGKEELVDKTK
jgi:hypothetical protein